MDKKYELTDEKIEVFGRTLYRIRALRDIPAIEVKAGDLGGFIEKEENLSHDDNAWVCGNAEVYGDARVYGNARVYGDARVCGNAEVYGNARVCGNARVYGNAEVIWLSKIGSRLGTTTVFKCADDTVKVTCGCFSGTLDEFAQKVEETHGDNQYGREYKAFIELVKIHFYKEN